MDRLPHLWLVDEEQLGELVLTDQGQEMAHSLSIYAKICTNLFQSADRIVRY
jgi:hypothetical protein